MFSGNQPGVVPVETYRGYLDWAFIQRETGSPLWDLVGHSPSQPAILPIEEKNIIATIEIGSEVITIGERLDGNTYRGTERKTLEDMFGFNMFGNITEYPLNPLRGVYTKPDGFHSFPMYAGQKVTRKVGSTDCSLTDRVVRKRRDARGRLANRLASEAGAYAKLIYNSPGLSQVEPRDRIFTNNTVIAKYLDRDRSLGTQAGMFFDKNQVTPDDTIARIGKVAKNIAERSQQYDDHNRMRMAGICADAYYLKEIPATGE
jgi:hypothetical protein